MSDTTRKRGWWWGVLLVLVLAGVVFWRARTPEAPTAISAAETGAPASQKPIPGSALNQPTPLTEPLAQGVFIQRVDAGARKVEQAAATATTPAPPTPVAGPATLGGALGAIEGQITTTRSVPPAAATRMNSDPYCVKTGEQEGPSVDATGRVHWASVRVVSATALPAPTDPLIVEQRRCQYSPRVQNAVAGQAISVRNEDGALHNVHSYSGTRTLNNLAQPPGSSPVKLSADASVRVLKLKCDVHPWMTGFVVFNNNRFFAVSDSAGHYRIDPAPAGRYTVHVWQEVLGETDVTVEVLPGQTAVANIALP